MKAVRHALTIALMATLAAACGKVEPADGAAPASVTATSGETATSPRASAATAAPSTVPATDSGAANVALLNRYLEAWNQHDALRVGALFDEQSQYFDAAFAGMQNGREAIVENAVEVFLHGLPDLHWELRGAPIASSEGIAYEWTLTGTNTGRWGGVSPTHQKINLKGVSFMRVRQGKIVYQAVVYDSAALNRQLGL